MITRVEYKNGKFHMTCDGQMPIHYGTHFTYHGQEYIAQDATSYFTSDKQLLYVVEAKPVA